VDVGSRILLLGRLDESVYELVVLFAADSGLLQAKIEIIL